MEERNHWHRRQRTTADEALAPPEPGTLALDSDRSAGQRPRPAHLHSWGVGTSYRPDALSTAPALDATAPDATAPLLAGEDPETTYAEDARHCIRLYTELISFREELLSRAERALEGLSAETQQEVGASDLPLLHAQLASHRARLEFWSRRALELEGIDLDPEQRQLRYRGRHLELTRREYQLLACLIRHPHQYVSARRLVGLAWGDGLMDEQLRVYVVRLRRKLAEAGVPAQLANRPRNGYSLIFD